MAYEVLLPANETQREDVINKLVGDGEAARHIHEINWWVAHHYLQGGRNFTNINYQKGTLDVGYINEEGVLKFRYDDVVSKFQAQIGRLLQIDISPIVEKRSIGLEDLRKASIGQVALDAAFPKNKAEELKLKMFGPLEKYGAIGLAVWNEKQDMGIDVVMPWEVLPIPPIPLESSDVRGIMRVRWVPIDWVKKLSVTPGASSEVWKKMNRKEVPTGQVPTDSGGKFVTYNQVVDVDNTRGEYAGKKPEEGKSATKKDKTVVDAVKFVEVWTETTQGYLSSYDIQAGGVHLHKAEYPNSKLYTPMQMVTDIPTGGFWGRSFVSTLIPINTEMEYTIGRVFQNIQDIDIYGILMEPTTLGVSQEIFRGRDGQKRVRYEPDLTMPDLRPTNIQPFNSGSGPVDVIKVMAGVQNSLANQPTEMLQGGAPGRIDSNAALGSLYEISNTPLSPTAASIANGMSNCYRSMLNTMQAKWTGDKVVEISMLDDSLAGIVLDASSGTMSLAKNAIPHPDEVTVSVRSMMPRSKAQEKLELEEALKNQTIDLFEYRVEGRKRGLGLPIGGEAEWQNYRRAMMENIILFGDGKEPGEVIVDELDIHQVHIRVLQAFMARPEFYQADPAVRDKYKKHYKAHNEGMGGYPDQMPFPEDAAEEQVAADAMQASGPAASMGGLM